MESNGTGGGLDNEKYEGIARLKVDTSKRDDSIHIYYCTCMLSREFIAVVVGNLSVFVSFCYSVRSKPKDRIVSGATGVQILVSSRDNAAR
jgi:hypothetical protein